MAFFGLEAITKIIDSIKNSIPSWVSSLGNKDEKPTTDSEEHDDKSWGSEPHYGYHDDDYDDDYEDYNPDGEYYHEEYDADDGSYSVTEIGRRGAYDDDDNFSFVMFSEYDDDDY
jgi:hypothetical protein